MLGVLGSPIRDAFRSRQRRRSSAVARSETPRGRAKSSSARVGEPVLALGGQGEADPSGDRRRGLPQRGPGLGIERDRLAVGDRHRPHREILHDDRGGDPGEADAVLVALVRDPDLANLAQPEPRRRRPRRIDRVRSVRRRPRCVRGSRSGAGSCSGPLAGRSSGAARRRCGRSWSCRSCRSRGRRGSGAAGCPTDPARPDPSRVGSRRFSGRRRSSSPPPRRAGGSSGPPGERRDDSV
jgi:hypothetical protein